MTRPPGISIGLSVCIAVVLFSSACDSGYIFHFRNRTSEVLLIQVNQRTLDRLPEDSQRNLDYPPDILEEEGGRLGIIIADTRGCVVLRIDTTLDEFRDVQNSTVEITQSALPPPEERTDCHPDLAD